jgi:hypothetical protein
MKKTFSLKSRHLPRHLFPAVSPALFVRRVSFGRVTGTFLDTSWADALNNDVSRSVFVPGVNSITRLPACVEAEFVSLRLCHSSSGTPLVSLRASALRAWQSHYFLCVGAGYPRPFVGATQSPGGSFWDASPLQPPSPVSSGRSIFPVTSQYPALSGRQSPNMRRGGVSPPTFSTRAAP